ncbi:hypothetical protein K440DRAFT_304601 [Wilcoxina mikolae CBS 423.85]|nr:hypothetical protein K440DRAFT_304601 [Wilcoxina mikolae CBS 423.85]
MHEGNPSFFLRWEWSQYGDVLVLPGIIETRVTLAIVRGRGGQRYFYRFNLVRNDGQVVLELDSVRSRPTSDE